MKLTSKQKEILHFITENADEIQRLNAIATVKSKDFKIGDSVTVAGIKWSKFAEDEKGNSMMLADEAVCKMKFGDDNDWTDSDVREKCQEIAEKIKKELGSDALVEFETNLFSLDGLKDYGTVQDEVALLTFDLYRNNRENIKPFDEWWWLSTPNSTSTGGGSGGVRYVASGGCVCCDGCCGVGAVRPFFILKS